LHWDVFYKNNKDHFYKDRHYIKYEFLELVQAISKESKDTYKEEKLHTLLDYGCGVGNGFFPIVEEFGY
jgi:tRNAThr (cytosine32-N3)-methyltransferase